MASRRVGFTADALKLHDFLERNRGWQSLKRGAREEKAARRLEFLGFAEVVRHERPAQWQVRYIDKYKNNPPQGMPSKRAGAFRMEEGHVHIGKGLVYCPEARDSKAAVVTHSRVKCGFCGKTVQSAVNPPKAHLKADVRAFDRMMKELKTLKRRDLRNPQWGEGQGGSSQTKIGDTVYTLSYQPHLKEWRVYFSRYRGSMLKQKGSLGYFLTKKDAVTSVERDAYGHNPPTSPAAHFLRREMMEGKTPAQALRAVSRQLAGRVPRAALKGAFDAVKAEIMGGIEGDRTTMADWAGKAAMRLSSYKKFSRNPGYVKPRNGPVKIYGHTEKIYMQKTSGPYKGKKFVHEFKKGVEQIGFPRNTVVTTPDGKAFKLTTRCVLLSGPKDIWRNFPA